MTAPSRPEIIDQHGVVHRHGCPQPGWTVQTVHALPAWCGVRCAGCGAPSLHRSTRLGENQ